METTVRRVSLILRIGLGTLFVISGTDKFFNLLTYWPMYVSETFSKTMPVSAQTFMYAVGVGEALIGLAILGKPRLGGYLASAWMVAVSVNLITAGLYDLATRDLAIALGAFSVAQLASPAHAARAQPRLQHPASAGT